MLLSLAVLIALSGCSGPTPLSSSRPPVILVSLDTLRADHLGAWGDTRGLTPNLDRFAAESFVFDNAWSQANETVFSHASLFTSRYPSELGELTYQFHLPTTYPTLATVLGVYGYTTAAFVAGGHLDPAFGIGAGFQTFTVPREWGCLYHTVPPALAWLDQAGSEPFFLMVHGYDAHARYLKPSPLGHAYANPLYQGAGRKMALTVLGVNSIFGDRAFPAREAERAVDFRELKLMGPRTQANLQALSADPEGGMFPFTAEDHAYLRGVYAGAVAYGDAFFGLFMAGLEQRGLLDRALIVVMSDHGESLGENGLYNHRYSLTDADTHVVLMIRPPGGVAGGGRSHELVGLMDVMPTLLDVAGADLPAGTQGRSLVPLMEGGPWEPRPAMFTEGALRMITARSSDARLTFYGAAADSPFLADLLEAASLDGPFYEPSPGMSAAAGQALKGALLDWRSRVQVQKSQSTDVDPALIQALHERGYWGP